MSEDTPSPRPESMPEPSFLNLVLGLVTQVLMNLGEVPNPISGEVSADLEHAKYTIDLLGILKEKTRGNLSEEEDRTLDLYLYDLRMRFVECTRGGK